MRRAVDDAPDVRDEPHVEHPVGLVDDEDLRAVEMDLVPRVEVEEPSRRGDQQVDRPGQLPALAVHVLAAVDRHRPDAAVLSKRLCVALDLHCEFARRCKHQRPRRARPAVAGVGVAQEPGEDCDEEGRSLARSGLRPAGHVAALQRCGQRAGLDRRAVLESKVRNRMEDFRGDVEILKPRLALYDRNDVGRRIPRRRRRGGRRDGAGGPGRGSIGRSTRHTILAPSAAPTAAASLLRLAPAFDLAPSRSPGIPGLRCGRDLRRRRIVRARTAGRDVGVRGSRATAGMRMRVRRVRLPGGAALVTVGGTRGFRGGWRFLLGVCPGLCTAAERLQRVEYLL